MIPVAGIVAKMSLLLLRDPSYRFSAGRVIPSYLRLPFVIAAWFAALAFAAVTLATANPLYWDANGSATGSGNLGGIWGTDNFWTIDPLGLTATTAYASGNTVAFAAGTDGTGNYTVTLSSSQSAAGLRFEEGHVTIAPAATTPFNDIQVLTLTGTAPEVNVANMDSTITARMTSSGLLKTGFGKLTLDFGPSGNGGYFNLNGAPITISGGTFELRGTGTSANQLSSSNGIVVRSGATFLWNTNANSISDNTKITLNAGGILNTRVNDQFGTIEGSGTIVMRNASMNLAHGSVSTIFSGQITGNGAVQVNGGTGIVSLTNVNTFTGLVSALNTNVSTGGLRLAHRRAIQNGTLNLVNFEVTRSNFSFAGGIDTFVSGALQGTSNMLLEDAGGNAITLETGNVDSNTTYRGALGGSGGLTKIGMGTLTLTGERITVTRTNNTSGFVTATWTSDTSHTYTGDTTILAGAHNPNSGSVTQSNSGGIRLDFNSSAIASVNTGGNTYSYAITAPDSNIISASSRLVLGGGRLWVTGRSSGTAAVSQTFNNTHLLAGRSYLTVSQGTAATGTVVHLGGISRNPGSVLEFTLPAGTQSLTNGVTTTTANDTSGILGGWAITGTDWAVKDAAGVTPGNIVAAAPGIYTAYTGGDIPSFPSSNLLVNNNISPITTGTGVTDLNTIMVRNDAGNGNAAVNRTLDIGAGETLRLGLTGSIWNQGSQVTAGVPAFTIGTADNVGILTAGGAPDTAGEIILNNSGSGEMLIRSSIQDNGTGAVTLIRTGSGNQVVFSGANTHSGGSVFTHGRTRLDNALALGSGAVTVIPGGQLWFNRAGTYANVFHLGGTGYGENGVPGAIRFSGGQNLSGQINLAGDTRLGAVNASSATTLSGKITGDYSLDLSGYTGGTNVFILSNPENDFNGNFSLNTNFTTTPSAFSGGIVTVRLGADEVIPNGLHKGNLVLSGGTGISTLDLNGYSETVNSLISYGTHSNITITNTKTDSTSVLTIGDNHSTSIVTEVASSSRFFGGNIQDSGTGVVAVVKIGEGTQTLTGTNTYSGPTTITNGTLQAAAVATLSPNSDVILADDPTAILALTDGFADYSQTILSLSGGGAINLGTIAAADTAGAPATRLTTGSAANTTYHGTIAGAGGLVKQGAGRFILSGNNSYAGTTTVSAGILQVGAGGTSGTLGRGEIINNAALVFDRSDTLVVDNVISGSGSVSQSGAGITVFTGGHTYTGATRVEAGTLRLTSSLSNNNIASSDTVSVSSGATLDVGGISASGGFMIVDSQTLSGDAGGGGTVSGLTTILSGGSLAGGTDGDVGTLAFDAGLTMEGGSFWLVDLVGSVTPGSGLADRIDVSGGALSIGSGTNLMVSDADWIFGNTFTIATYTTLSPGSRFTFNSLELEDLDTFFTAHGGYQIHYGTGTSSGITLTAVPEPATLVFLTTGLAGCALAKRRRRRKSEVEAS